MAFAQREALDAPRNLQSMRSDFPSGFANLGNKMTKKIGILQFGSGQKFRFKVNGKTSEAGYTWFRGEHCNYSPYLRDLKSADSVEKWVVDGWQPEAKLIRPETKVVAFGSCFAANITRWLAARNFSVLTQKENSQSRSYVVRFGEGMVNTFVILQQFEWAFEGRQPEGDLWHGYDAQSFGYDEAVRQETKDLFDAADVFIITLGLSEIWYDELTGGVFWRAVPQDKYDATRHKFRVSTVAENKANILKIIALIKKHKPQARIIFTLSPIPLVATFRPNSCITSNSVSKAILRAALDEALREAPDRSSLYYWPSYEIVTDIFANRWKNDRRHVDERVLDFIMALFMKFWCEGHDDSHPLEARWRKALQAEAEISVRRIGPRVHLRALVGHILRRLRLKKA